MCQILIQCHHLCRRCNQYFIPLSPGVNYLYVPNYDFLAQVEVATMFALLIQRRLRWLGHVTYSTASYATGTRPAGGPTCRFIEVCKRDLKAGNVNPAAWEAVAVDRSHRRLAVKESTQACEESTEAQTAVGSISTHRAIHGIHPQQLQQSLPIQNRIVPQQQKVLQLNH